VDVRSGLDIAGSIVFRKLMMTGKYAEAMT
jgi:hypothetical protein